MMAVRNVARGFIVSWLNVLVSLQFRVRCRVRCGEGRCEERSQRMGPGARGGSREAMKCHDGSEKCGARLYCVLV